MGITWVSNGIKIVCRVVTRSARWHNWGSKCRYVCPRQITDMAEGYWLSETPIEKGSEKLSCTSPKVCGIFTYTVSFI